MANKGAVRFDQVNRITSTRYRLLDTLNTEPVDLFTGERAVPVDGKRFVTECEQHSTVVGWKNLHQARMAMAMPNWCGRQGGHPTKCCRVLAQEGVNVTPSTAEETPAQEEVAA